MKDEECRQKTKSTARNWSESLDMCYGWLIILETLASKHCRHALSNHSRRRDEKFNETDSSVIRG